MPALGLTMTEGRIVRWLKKVGDRIAKDDALLLVETDKAETEVLAQTDGVLIEILAAADALVPVGNTIARFARGNSAEAVASTTQTDRSAKPAPPPEREPARTSAPAETKASPVSAVRPTTISTPIALPRSTPSDPAPIDGSEAERLAWMHRAMLRIRFFDERIVRLFAAGKIAGALHSYVGEEAVAAGVCSLLRPDDNIVSTHRGHGHLLAKGGRMDRMMAELYGRIDGYCHGKGGSMHITDVGLGILGANGIVGAGIPIATGAGTAIRMQGGDQVVVCFFGDGASNIGSFHEGLNLAATWKLPIVFVCENNGYAQFTPQSMHAAIPDLFNRAAGYGMPGVSVDGNDVIAMAETAGEAIARARTGRGPSLLEAKTYRWFGHAINNPASAIGRPEEEIESWKARDPIPRHEALLIRHGFATAEEIAATRALIAAELEDAIAFAEASPSPRPEDALTDVYSDSTFTAVGVVN